MPDLLTRVDEGETQEMSANYVHVTGPVACIRCDYSTAIEHEMGARLEVQQELLMGHINAVHPDWQLDGFKKAFEREQLRSEHQRLQSAVVEKARIMLELHESVGHVCLDVEDTLEATRALIAFEAEHKIGEGK